MRKMCIICSEQNRNVYALISNMEYVTTKTCIEYRSPNLCQKHEHNISQRLCILKKK